MAKAENWKVKRQKAALAARYASKINAAFLNGLETTLGLQVKEVAEALKISPQIFSKYRAMGVCPDYVLERVNALLAVKGISPLTSSPAAPAAADSTPKTALPMVIKPPKGSKAEQVPSGFLEGIEERLGIHNKDLLKLLGTQTGMYFTWKKRGYCPVWVRTAVNGLMAEKKVINGEAHEHLPRRGRPPGTNGTKKHHIIDGNYAVTLHVEVPHDKLAMASALMASFGFQIRTES